MKIRLSAFNGKMFSEPIDVPDNTSPEWDMAMPMDVLKYKPDTNTFVPTTPTMKRCRFQRTNLSWLGKDVGLAENVPVYEYRLTDVS